MGRLMHLVFGDGERYPLLVDAEGILSIGSYPFIFAIFPVGKQNLRRWGASGTSSYRLSTEFGYQGRLLPFHPTANLRRD